MGAGPNGLAAAITLARKRLSVLLIEARDTIGGSARTEALTLPGFLHDTCSAVHPMAAVSPFFRSAGLEAYGLEWIQPPIPLAHPLDAEAVVLEQSLDATAEQLGRRDGAAYRRLMEPFVGQAEAIFDDILRPFLRFPKNPVALARFGLPALLSARALAGSRFKGERARALFAGLAAHSFLPLNATASASFGLVLGMAGHAVGWPIAKGGSGEIANALGASFQALGGTIQLDRPIGNIRELPTARATLLDLTPRQIVRLAGDRLPGIYRGRLARYRYGPGVFKLDYALSEPIPWLAESCRRAGTIHVGGFFNQIAASERLVSMNQHAADPFVLVAQPSLFDDTRAPEGRHVAWVYCHVPKGSALNMTERVERQIERFAPGFRDVILARSVLTTKNLEDRNANLVGGDINGGATDILQLIGRPVFSLNPYRTSVPGLYICSSSTPPGGGVHGMCGYNAAAAAWKDIFSK